MTEAEAVLSFVVDALADAGVAAYHGMAPADAPAPWCVALLGSGEDTLTGGSARGYSEFSLMVRCSAPGSSAAGVLALVGTVDGALHDASGSAGGRTIHAARIESVVFAELVDGAPHQVAANVYRVSVR